MTLPLLVTVFTDGTAYADDAAALAASARTLGYDVRCIGMPDGGDWWSNVAAKPQALFDVMRGHDGPVLFLDADCRIVAPIEGVDAVLNRCDVAAVRRPDNCFTARINSGVVLFNANDAARAVAQEWAHRASLYARFHRFGDQGALGEALALAKPRARFASLPASWNTDAVDDEPPEDCAIVHLKRSRSSRSSLDPPGDGDTAQGASDQLRLILMRPDPEQCEGGTYAKGVVATGTDMVESARRYGLGYDEMMALHASGGVSGCSGGEMLTGMHYAYGRDNCDVALLVTYDSVLVRDPAPIFERLEHADVVLAWNHDDRDALPAPGMIGLRAASALRDVLVPPLKADLLSRSAPDDGLVSSLAAVLREPPAGIRVATLPRRTVATIYDADEHTVVMRVGRNGDREA